MENISDTIRANLDRVTEQIELSAARAGRAASDVRLLVVTKAQPLEKVRAAYEAGARLFGENYPEETLAKIEAARSWEAIEWHMIGHLQSRKARIVARDFDMLHSLDSQGLAEKLERILAEFGRVLPVLLEVNVSGEESKSGFSAWQEACWPELLPVIGRILEMPHLQVRGLMTMPPLLDDPQAVRPFFARTRQLCDYLSSQFPAADWAELSMGTSSDYQIAIEERATYVRIGTAIVGPRPDR